jgi:hypothetical protein
VVAARSVVAAALVVGVEEYRTTTPDLAAADGSRQRLGRE